MYLKWNSTTRRLFRSTSTIENAILENIANRAAGESAGIVARFFGDQQGVVLQGDLPGLAVALNSVAATLCYLRRENASNVLRSMLRCDEH
jgi:hypothetical protein